MNPLTLGTALDTFNVSGIVDNAKNAISSLTGGLEKVVSTNIGKAISRVFTLPDTPTPGKDDPEYIQNVKNEVASERAIAEKALSLAEGNESLQRQIIQSYNAELAKWGDLNNPNRNVADPAGFKNSMQKIIDDLTSGSSTGGQNTGQNTLGDMYAGFDKLMDNLFKFPSLRDSLSPTPQGYIINGKSPDVVIVPRETSGGIQPATVLLIGGVGLLGYLLFKGAMK